VNQRNEAHIWLLEGFLNASLGDFNGFPDGITMQIDNAVLICRPPW
jgi:hypothetical protein